MADRWAAPLPPTPVHLPRGERGPVPAIADVLCVFHEEAARCQPAGWREEGCPWARRGARQRSESRHGKPKGPSLPHPLGAVWATAQRWSQRRGASRQDLSQAAVGGRWAAEPSTGRPRSTAAAAPSPGLGRLPQDSFRQASIRSSSRADGSQGARCRLGSDPHGGGDLCGEVAPEARSKTPIAVPRTGRLRRRETRPSTEGGSWVGTRASRCAPRRRNGTPAQAAWACPWP